MTERADGLPERAPKEKDASPNSTIDKALKDLLKQVTDTDIIPENITAKVRVVQTAIMWEKVKHHIKDEGEFDPESI
jgi:hypothetical protein